MITLSIGMIPSRSKRWPNLKEKRWSMDSWRKSERNPPWLRLTVSEVKSHISPESTKTTAQAAEKSTGSGEIIKKILTAVKEPTSRTLLTDSIVENDFFLLNDSFKLYSSQIILAQDFLLFVSYSSLIVKFKNPASINDLPLDFKYKLIKNPI